MQNHLNRPGGPVGATVTVLAMPDGARFVQQDSILRVEPDGAIAYYCPAANWEKSEARRAAQLEADIAAAQAKLAELLAAQAKLGGPAAAASAPPTKTPKTAKPRQHWTCLKCGRGINNFHIHGRAAHPEVLNVEELKGELRGPGVAGDREPPQAGPGAPEGAGQGEEAGASQEASQDGREGK